VLTNEEIKSIINKLKTLQPGTELYLKIPEGTSLKFLRDRLQKLTREAFDIFNFECIFHIDEEKHVLVLKSREGLSENETVVVIKTPEGITNKPLREFLKEE
jgi:hypothetical protein